MLSSLAQNKSTHHVLIISQAPISQLLIAVSVQPSCGTRSSSFCILVRPPTPSLLRITGSFLSLCFTLSLTSTTCVSSSTLFQSFHLITSCAYRMVFLCWLTILVIHNSLSLLFQQLKPETHCFKKIFPNVDLSFSFVTAFTDLPAPFLLRMSVLLLVLFRIFSCFGSARKIKLAIRQLFG